MEEAKGTWHAWPLRVRYQETDQMGVVYHMNYLNWFEIGRTEAIRALGIAYRDLEAEGLFLPLTDAQMVFKRAARYDDEVVVYTKLVSGSTGHVWLNREWHPTRLDHAHPALFALLKRLRDMGESTL